DGKAHFTPNDLSVEHALYSGGRKRDGLPVVANVFRVSTRRGKQFNSMVQRDVDPLTGAKRDDVLISEQDLDRLHLSNGASAELLSATGTFRGQLKAAPIAPGNLAVHWPEANTLMDATAVDPEALEPDYNALVVIRPL